MLNLSIVRCSMYVYETCRIISFCQIIGLLGQLAHIIYSFLVTEYCFELGVMLKVVSTMFIGYNTENGGEDSGEESSAYLYDAYLYDKDVTLMGDKGCCFLRIDTGFLVVNCSLSAPPLGCWIPTGIVLDVKRDVLSARCCSEGASVDTLDSSHLLSHREVSLSTSEFNVKSFPVLYCRD